MARVLLLIGGNIGDVKARLQCVQQLLNDQVGAVLRCSHRHESEAWGFKSENVNLFSNQVLEISTDLSPLEVLDKIQEIEVLLGRDRVAERAECASLGECYASRMIDIDILFYDNDVISTDRLQIPHPRIAEREFVLVPLCEIMRKGTHPVTGKTMEELLTALRESKK